MVTTLKELHEAGSADDSADVWLQRHPELFCHHHHLSVMQLGQLLTRSGLAYPEVSLVVCRNFFCQSQNSVSLPWVIYYEAFYLHVLSSFSCIPVICPELVVFLITL